MLFSLIRDLFDKDPRVNFTYAVVFIIAALVVIFVTMPFHEFAHAFVATKLGDKTAKWQGRLTLNPLSHIDYMGALGILLFGFGWARPVPINPSAFKNPKRGMAITALAGPVMNLILAFIGSFFSFGILRIYLKSGAWLLSYIAMIFSIFSSLNIGLAVFNLLPIPPLDGWKILGALLPARIYWKIMSYERYISFGLIILIFTGVLDGPIYFLRDLLTKVVNFIPGLIFSFGIG